MPRELTDPARFTAVTARRLHSGRIRIDETPDKQDECSEHQDPRQPPNRRHRAQVPEDWARVLIARELVDERSESSRRDERIDAAIRLIADCAYQPRAHRRRRYDQMAGQERARPDCDPYSRIHS